MPDYSPPYANGAAPFTVTASAVVTGGTVVESTTTGACAATGAASSKVLGVAAHDAPSGGRISIWPLPGVVHEVTNTAGNTVGDNIVSAAGGLVAQGALALGTALGTAVATAGVGAKTRFLGR
jgi:hypothetical protein